MTTENVDVYLDVDGVLNAFAFRDHTPEWGWSPESLRSQVINGFPITWSTELIDRLNALADREHVQFHWLTTWLRDAPEVLCGIDDGILLRGSQWPVLGEEEYGQEESYHSWWKLPAAQMQFQSRGHRVVWIDDDLYDHDAREWISTLGDRIMAVCPNSSLGITPEMLTMIEEWVG